LKKQACERRKKIRTLYHLHKHTKNKKIDCIHYALKIFLLAAVGSYYAIALYWFIITIPWIVEISIKPEYNSPATGLLFIKHPPHICSVLIEYSGFFVLMICLVDVSYAPLVALLILKTETNSFTPIRDKTAIAQILEGIYFFSLITTIYFLLNFSALPFSTLRPQKKRGKFDWIYFRFLSIQNATMPTTTAMATAAMIAISVLIKGASTASVGSGSIVPPGDGAVVTPMAVSAYEL
jgi:hypothetical protein